MTHTTMFSNPVTRAVEEIEGRIATLGPDKIAGLEESATLDMGDWLHMGDKASLALAMGIIDANTAQTIHMIHTDFHRGASLAQRLVFLMVMAEILGKVAGR